MRVTLSHFGKMNFTASGESGHRITLSASAEAGGENHGARPMEAVLMALGGCSGIDVLHILRKSRQRVSDCEIDIDAERADATPAVFTRIHLHYRIGGRDLSHHKVARAVELSMEKYCSVTRMLQATVAITHGFEIIERGDSEHAQEQAQKQEQGHGGAPSDLL